MSWLVSRSQSPPLSRRYPLRRLWWLCRFAGGPLRALRGWWALRKTKRATAAAIDHYGTHRGLMRIQDETDAEFRTRLFGGGS